MANLYPQELLDVESTIDCVKALFDAWLCGDRGDKIYAIHMDRSLDILNRDLASMKDRFRREAKMLLELTGEKVPT